ncbi:hypothetical protein [Mycobacterium sp. URHB0044]|jgi:hypothetical protein|uniref:hypothetical protein n=1 Tax=Mycobacterium sp. URHB0044 TaxID=1380386 RepID=UPI00048D4F25|nr:hypothetical protein [Mycobacterium sp. URHB0044]
MDDPKDIAKAFADDANKIIDESQKVAVDAFKKINKQVPNQPITYTAGDAIKSMTELAKIAATGGIEIGQTALEVEPTKGVLILADHVATVVGRAIKDAATVVSEAADQVDKNAFKQNQWTQSAIKLANIALLRGAEIVQTVAAGPAQYANPVVKELFTLAAGQVDPINDRVLTLVTLKLGGPPTLPPVASYRVSFEPTGGVLKAGKNEFTLVVNSAGLASGLYIGSVEISVPGATPPQVLNFPVAIAL